MNYEEAEVVSIHEMTPDVKQFELELNGEWSYRPGQHSVIRFERDGEEVERPYTPVTLPGTGLCLAIRRYDDGNASVWMHNREQGDVIDISRPDGNLYIRDFDRDVVLISTGTGATPMYAMLRDYLRRGTGKAFYMHGEKTQEDILFRESLDQLEAENSDLEVVYSLSDEDWSGRTGYIQEHVGDVAGFQKKDFYVCGVPKMVVETEELLKENGVPEENIYTEGWESDAA